MGITGPNGSGKTTLMRIICYLLQPSEGKVSYRLNNETIEREQIYKHIGFVGPYLELYEDLTARENLRFFAQMKDLADSDERIDALLEKFRLQGREDDLVKAYSSGMKQRLKYVFALLNKPSVLMVDEPRANLDEEGIQTVYDILSQQKKENILIVATNEREDLTYTDWTLPIDA
jgi:heme exporter protein A